MFCIVIILERLYTKMIKFVDEISVQGFATLLMNNFRELCAHAFIVKLSNIRSARLVMGKDLYMKQTFKIKHSVCRNLTVLVIFLLVCTLLVSILN